MKNNNISLCKTQFQKNWEVTMKELAEFNHDLKRKEGFPQQSYKVTGKLSGEYYQQSN